MSFVSTENLVLRSFRESDLDRLADLWTNYDAQRTEPSHVLPPRPDKLKSRLPDIINGFTLFVIVEAKALPADMADQLGPDGKPDLWVGQCFLRPSGAAKNRTAELGVSFETRWWSKGFGTEVVRWIVDYAFNNLNLNRVELQCLADNERAVRVYKKW
jgi:RimJ/RimL family protein N-acetyltransferase